MKNKIKEMFSFGNGNLTKKFVWLVVISGVAIMFFKGIVWGASHQIVAQPVIKQALELQKPWRIEDVKPQVIISPLAERFGTENLTPLEEKILEKWGYKDGVIALAIFDCESGLDQYAVSTTGDLGITQINWRAHRAKIEVQDRTSADLLIDVDFNLEVAYSIWESSGWNAWTVFNTGAYLSCLQ